MVANIITFLEGKKTYIITGLGALTVVGYMFNLIDLQTANMLLGLFGFGSIAALRASK